MKPSSTTYRVLGAAFVLQFVTSLASGLAVKLGLAVEGDIHQTMLNIAAQPGLLQASILGEAITAIGITFLGVMLFVTLRRVSEAAALVGMLLYVLEAALLAVSRMASYALLEISQQYAAGGFPAGLLPAGSLAFAAANFGYQLAMLFFCSGALILYTLLDRARIVPRWLSLWGLVAVLPCLVGTLAQFAGVSLPFAIYLPYVPFECAIGIWLLVMGARETAQAPAAAPLAGQPLEVVKC